MNLSRWPALVTILAVLPVAASAQQVSYDVSFPNAAHHEARVRMTLTGAHGPVEARMAVSSPGRYALTGFAKNVYDVSAVDGRGRDLAVTHIDPEGWTIAGHDGTVVVSYTVFGDRSDGTYLQVDNAHAHINMPALFMWVRGWEGRPIRATFHVPDGSGWKIATQLLPTSDSTTFTAPGLNYFMDSPTELSNFTERSWTVTSSGQTYTLRIALHHLGTDAEADSFAAMAQRVVAQEIAVFGETPAYETGRYTFIADYLPWASGDGMEHRNSTILSSSGNLATNSLGLLSTLAHEYFHSWNMKRIRSRAIEPFDLARANMSDELWEGEGFTQYYGQLMMRRAGFTSDADFARQLGFAVSNVTTSPGRRFFSPVGMSEQAPWRDGAAAVDPTNAPNIFISYYTWGACVALAMDLTLRERFGRTLDDYMRQLWADNGRPEHYYTMADLERALARVSGDAAFAADFFTRYVRGREVPDYARLLAPAGFLLRKAAPNSGTLGAVTLQYAANGALVMSPTQMGTPLYDGGIDRGDRIITIDGRNLTSDSVLAGVRAAHHPGDIVPVEFESRGRRLRGHLTFIEDPRLEIVRNEDAGLGVTPDMQALRTAWLGAR